MSNLSQAAIAIDNVLEVLRSRRQNSESQLAVTFQAATSMLQCLGISEVMIPRTSSRQTCRDNQPAATAEDYYRISIYNTMLDGVISYLQSRLPTDTVKAFSLCNLLPCHIVIMNEADMKNCVNVLLGKYREVISAGLSDVLTDFQLQAEFELWRFKCKGLVSAAANNTVSNADFSSV